MSKEEFETRIVTMRLQKFLARAGAASRRGSENLMTAGRVMVNGQVITELGSKVNPLLDKVFLDGVQIFLADSPTTLMLHKPTGVITSMSDPQGRPTVADLVPTKDYPGLFPIGRLDFDTTGLLLFSTDGELGHGLLHPRRHVTKYYTALVEGTPTNAQLEQMCAGLQLDDGITLPAEVTLFEGAEAQQARACLEEPVAPLRSSREYAALGNVCAQECSVVRVGICEGRKNQVKRMFRAVGHPVVALHRTSFGPVSLGDVPRGAWRMLDAMEVGSLVQATQSTCAIDYPE